jgi:hypothetical protein
MEAIAAEVATEVYGRAPRRLRHLGTYACRRIRAYPHLVSEHALGNAIDVAGFDFGRAKDDLPASVPRRLRRPFRVRVAAHWNADSERPVAGLHRRFLRSFARRILDEPELFRVVLGPAWPGHTNHFHFDVAPYEVEAVFEKP